MSLLLQPLGGPPHSYCRRRRHVGGAAGDAAEVESLVVGEGEVEAVVGREVEAADAAQPARVGHGGRGREVEDIAADAADATADAADAAEGET